MHGIPNLWLLYVSEGLGMGFANGVEYVVQLVSPDVQLILAPEGGDGHFLFFGSLLFILTHLQMIISKAKKVAFEALGVEIYNKPTNFQDYFIQSMKKLHAKPNNSNRHKIQLKINSKTVTNNYILTPMTPSPRDPAAIASRTDRHPEDLQPNRLKIGSIALLKHSKDNKNSQFRRAATDNPKIQSKKKFDEDETGTHTPFVKRVSLTQQGFHKKKSSHSIVSSDKIKQKKRLSDRSSKNISGQLCSSTFQRVIGIIIKDYKEGRLKDKELQQTLLQLYERKQKKTAPGKKKKKLPRHQPFSNQLLKSINNQTRSQGLVRKRRQSSDEEIEERVLEREGFVNKIIIKGIATSMFLKEEDSQCFFKDNNNKKITRQPSFHIHTSNSVKQINQDMRMIGLQINSFNNQSSIYTYQDQMATRIQRAWRRYRTKKLLNNARQTHCNQNAFNIVDYFTDEEPNDNVDSPIDGLKVPRQKLDNEEHFQFEQLAKMVVQSLQSKKLSKEECLKNILTFLNVPSQQFQIDEESQHSDMLEGEEASEPISIEDVKSQANESEEEVIQSRVKILEIPSKYAAESLQSSPSNQLELNSFTNKYSSKEVIDNLEFFKEQSVIEQKSELDKSLTFVHSQTTINETFKTINIVNIENALKSREDAVTSKKQREIQELTQRLFSNKISKQQYLKEKEQIDKWFKCQLKQLKSIKKSLLKSCSDACKVLEKQHMSLTSQKSHKMLRCLSDKYIQRKSWALDRNQPALPEKKQNKIKKMKCQIEEEEEEENDLRVTDLGIKQNIQNEEYYQSQPCLIFNSKGNHSQESKPNRLQISPKMHRLLEQPDDIGTYNYEQIEKAIQEEEEAFEEGLPQFQNITHQPSEKFEASEEEQLQQNQISLINNFVNEKSKFKYLCQEDKQDIFEFLFLDLVLEMFTDTGSGQNRILRAAEVYIAKAKRLKKIPKGIKTNISASKDYLRILTTYVLQQSNSLRNLSLPMGPSAVQMLKYMRDEIVQTDEEEAVSSTLVLPIDVFEKVSRSPELELKLDRYYDDQERQVNRLSFLKTAFNINNKALFDCLNEMLDHERPYGVWGKPFPWKKVLSLDRKWSRSQEESKLKKSIEKTVQSCSYLCGILVDKQDSLFGSHRVSQEYVMQIREDRLSKMLANEVNSEERWIFYDDEETQIFMEVSSFITKKLIKEIVLDIVSINMKI